MCGIALILSGIRLDLSSLLPDSPSPPPPKAELTTPTNHSNLDHGPSFSLDDLKSALRRRGPDSLAARKLTIQSKISTSNGQRELVSAMEDESSANGENSELESDSPAELRFIGATLQLRGLSPVVQPFVDSSGNILIYNGEVFGGIDVGTDNNDGMILMQMLGKCCACRSSSGGHTDRCVSPGNGGSSVPEVLSVIKGPWAIIFWQDSSRTLWFGRDAFGRRSLLVHWPTLKDPQFLLSSVSPFSCAEQPSGMEIDNSKPSFWEELSCGVYSLMMDASKLDGCLIGEARKHKWTNFMLTEMIKWDRASVEPQLKELQLSCCTTQMEEHNLHSAHSGSLAAQNVLNTLRKSLMLRTSLHSNFPFQGFRHDDGEDELVPVAILFSGGLDSMILAALLDECLDPGYGIDLLNVSFDGQSAPDRISARAGVEELRRIAPYRRWKLVEIDAELSNLTWELKHVMSLIKPASTYMDLNIGIALWLAARGHGWVNKGSSNGNDDNQQCFMYNSKARIVLVGSGADEQCAGYGRHRTKYRSGSWLGLHEEMKLDMQRIWKRNMGRDDRCIADNGKEARFPFLDEDVVRILLDIPLWEVANLDQPSGTGDKKILREVARMLGLREAAIQPKRAIQFGSRIARESNRKNFGSNRAANQASAGSQSINVL